MTAGTEIILGLTPIQKWQAVNNYQGGYISEHWFILTCLVVLIALFILLYYVIKMNQRTKRQDQSNSLFSEYAQQKGLSEREYDILLDVVSKTNLKEKESIFTMPQAFSIGATAIAQKTLELQGSEAAKQLIGELSILREKLGFQKQSATPNGSAEKSNKPSSRQIPPGKTLHMTRRENDAANVESTVVDNNDVQLTIKLTVSLESRPGEKWCVRYYFGASVWEFETSVLSCQDNILVLNHSDNVRFINRRRFVRVPVNQPTYIAQFPFDKTLSSKDSGDNMNDSVNEAKSEWGPPDFVPAAVTELAGPGLRIEAPLDVNIGDRVLVIFKLDEESQNQDPNRKETAKTIRIVEDIGEVRHTKAVENGFSIAVELTGLSDSNINELVRATNAASLKANGKNIEEPVTLQGV